MPEKRKSRRYDMHLPIELVRTGSRVVHAHGETHNMSAVGVLFTVPCDVPKGDVVEYQITLPDKHADGTPVQIRCLGRVVRVIEADEEGQTTFAASLERYEFQRDGVSPRKRTETKR